jgi:hypothetical protein
MNDSSLPPSVEQLPRKSHVIAPAHPYNESFIKTLDSSEFSQGFGPTEMLPG